MRDGGLTLGSYAATKTAADIVAACLVVAAVLLAWRAWPTRKDQMFWYPSGTAQLIDGEPEPRVARWDDVGSVTVVFDSRGDGGTYLARCTIGRRGGSTLTADLVYGSRVPHDLAVQAARSLAPRLVPPLIEAYDAGKPVIFGDTTIDRTGITRTTADTGETIAIAWPDMRRIDIYEKGEARDTVGEQPVSLIGITVGRRRALNVSLSGRPNGVLIPYLIEHAAQGPACLSAVSTGGGPQWSARRDGRA